jgi:hypothetical protein
MLLERSESSTAPAIFGFSLEERPRVLFSMRTSILVSQDASERLKLLHEICAMVRTVLQLHKDYVQARSKPSTAPHFVQGDKVSLVTKNLFLRGQPNRKLRDRQLGPFKVEEQIGKLSYRLRLLATVRFYPVFHVNNLRPCSTTSLRHYAKVIAPGGYDEEFDVSHICAVDIKSLDEEVDICFS